MLTKDSHSLQLLNQAYGEYLAARCLLLNELYLQGATMASNAVEKYLKSILVYNGFTKKDIRVHLNNIEPLKLNLKRSYIDITEKFDQHFFEILSTVYTMRYHDDIKKPITLSFFVNQFLGELDSFVHYIQSLITSISINGKAVSSHYRRDAIAKEPKLLDNNFLFGDLSKKDFMEKPDTGYGYYVNPDLGHEEIILLGKNVINKYNGTMTKIEMVKNL